MIVEYDRFTGEVTGDNRSARLLIEDAARVCWEFGKLATTHSATAMDDILAAKKDIIVRANELSLADLLPPSWITDPDSWPVTVNPSIDCPCAGCLRSYLTDEDRTWLTKRGWAPSWMDEACEVGIRRLISTVRH